MSKKKDKIKRPDLDFEVELQHGGRTYDRGVGDWWLEQSNDLAHQKAYRHIAEYIRAQIPKTPNRIIDYACGAGNLLVHLCDVFPDSEIIGIDGSNKMIDTANERLAAINPDWTDRVEFWESDLPNFELPDFQADLLIFCFPNICPDEDDQDYYDEHGAEHKSDKKVAKWLSKAREEDPDEETCFDKPSVVFTGLMDCKVVSRNIHQLLRPKGWCARIEYANSEWDELTKLVRMRQAFEQGFLGKKVNGRRPEKIFKKKSSRYFPSEVISDVYHQTGDESDLEGGYQINILKAKVLEDSEED
ncbi:MAG: class I SAM-dependent methyltransferase [Candidatus Sumerlaeia bacterium]